MMKQVHRGEVHVNSLSEYREKSEAGELQLPACPLYAPLAEVAVIIAINGNRSFAKCVLSGST